MSTSAGNLISKSEWLLFSLLCQHTFLGFSPCSTLALFDVVELMPHKFVGTVFTIFLTPWLWISVTFDLSQGMGHLLSLGGTDNNQGYVYVYWFSLFPWFWICGAQLRHSIILRLSLENKWEGIWLLYIRFMFLFASLTAGLTICWEFPMGDVGLSEFSTLMARSDFLLDSICWSKITVGHHCQDHCFF